MGLISVVVVPGTQESGGPVVHDAPLVVARNDAGVAFHNRTVGQVIAAGLEVGQRDLHRRDFIVCHQRSVLLPSVVVGSHALE